MMLKNKVAVIYGAGGAIGGAVARTFVRKGAKAFLAGSRSRRTSGGGDTTFGPMSKDKRYFMPNYQPMKKGGD